MIAATMMICITDSAGARLKETRSAPTGVTSSLVSSLTMSARVWRRPYGPARFGPTRSCRRAATLRSSQIRKIAEVSTMINKSSTPTTSATIEISSIDQPRLRSRSLNQGPICAGSLRISRICSMNNHSKAAVRRCLSLPLQRIDAPGIDQTQEENADE